MELSVVGIRQKGKEESWRQDLLEIYLNKFDTEECRCTAEAAPLVKGKSYSLTERGPVK
jgi:hypothetical protein